ncbi:MAG: CPBP family intramembrane metalloprotease [Dysgonamonadaceae bacterium]|jgi:membrane protease YdiL (CAAX protease family)|nr:CPBP family intramembrane metalloprotease [Dysgonamonadaceae bacterium]
MYRIYHYLYKSKAITILLFGIFSALCVNFLLVCLNTLLNLEDWSEVKEYSTTIKDFFIIVGFAPFVETFCFQYAPLKIAGLFVKKYKHLVFIIIAVSVLFGLLHQNSTVYFIIVFFYSLIWSFCCFLFIRRKQHPLLFTTLIHASYNGVLFGTKLLLTFSVIK